MVVCKDVYRYDCSSCKRRCDGISKMFYNFQNDVAFSEYYENLLINRIMEEGYFAKKTDKEKYPDIEVYTSEGGMLLCYIEVKVQRRTFMSVQKCLPDADLVPSETLALNLSDLEHYIEQSRTEDVPIYIMWVLAERPCIVAERAVAYFYNHISEFERILAYYGDKRRFRRASGRGDVVNGQHKGVVINYHFSIAELRPFSLNEILKEKRDPF